jgi:acetyl esterase/lipase
MPEDDKSFYKSSYKKLLDRIKKHRQKIAELTGTMGNSANVESLHLEITLTDGTHLPIVIYRPDTNWQGPYPTIFHIPGSGFNTLNPYFAHVTCSQLAEKSRCQVIVINHRLAPEYPFPYGQHDASEVFCTLMKSAVKLRIEGGKVALSGYSSGGLFAASIANQAKKKGLDIRHVFLISPLVDLSGTIRQLDKANQDTGVKQSFVTSMKEYYLYLVKNLKDPKLSPFLQETSINHPPTDIVCGENDRFLSDSVSYNHKLSENKIHVLLKLFPNEGHGAFWYNLDVIRFIAARTIELFHLFSIPKGPIVEAMPKKIRLPVNETALNATKQASKNGTIKTHVNKLKEQSVSSGSQFCNKPLQTSSLPIELKGLHHKPSNKLILPTDLWKKGPVFYNLKKVLTNKSDNKQKLSFHPPNKREVIKIIK